MATSTDGPVGCVSPVRILATVGSATKPSIRADRVIPNWAPERWTGRRRRSATTRRAPASPSAAAASIRARSTATKLNSAATKKALAANNAAMASRPVEMDIWRKATDDWRGDPAGVFHPMGSIGDSSIL